MRNGTGDPVHGFVIAKPETLAAPGRIGCAKVVRTCILRHSCSVLQDDNADVRGQRPGRALSTANLRRPRGNHALIVERFEERGHDTHQRAELIRQVLLDRRDDATLAQAAADHPPGGQEQAYPAPGLAQSASD